MVKITELLAPAGSAEAFKAAIVAGANAIYFGLDSFNARERAENIKLDELSFLISLAKNANVKTYLTLNILIYDSEIKDAVELVSNAIKAGIDAVIVQDIGMISVLRKSFPSLEIHASTQMTTHNLEQCKVLASLGVSQVNLSRELSIEEMKPLVKYLSSQNIVAEVFIHGAFCISYSGQCYLSGKLYNLEGNRGKCVQPCRREYCCGESGLERELCEQSNGQQIAKEQRGCAQNTRQQFSSALGDNTNTRLQFSKNQFTTPFNLKDNNGFAILDKLLEIGVGSLKIEGRIKSPEYVWAVTSAWRDQIDSVFNGKKLVVEDERLSNSMNRGFTAGYLNGDITKTMFNVGVLDAGKKDFSLVDVGIVENYHADSKTLTIQPTQKKIINQRQSTNSKNKTLSVLSLGDKISIQYNNGRFVCTGIIKAVIGESKYSIEITGKLEGKIEKGQRIFKIPEVISSEKLKEMGNSLQPLRKKLSVIVSGKLNLPLTAVFSTKVQNRTVPVTVTSNQVLTLAQKRGLSEDVISEKFSKLGGTDFVLQEIDCRGVEENLFLQLTELNEMRRLAVEKLLLQFASANETQPANENENNNGGKSFDSIKNEIFFHSDSALTNASSSLSKKLKTKRNVKFVELETESATLINQSNFAETLKTSTDSGDIPKKSAQDVLALRIPLSFSYEPYLTFIKQNTEVVPYFEAIMFEEDFIFAVKFLEHLKKTYDEVCLSELPVIIVENLGFGKVATNIGFSVVPGYHLNITNSYSVFEYKRLFNSNAIIPSIEISTIQQESLALPENVSLWVIPPSEEIAVMQSRQCLVCNMPDIKTKKTCQRHETDKDCLANCERTVLLRGKQGETIVARKKRGFYSALYIN